MRHKKWCERKGQLANMSGGYCSTCGERVEAKADKREGGWGNPGEDEEERDVLRRQLAGAVDLLAEVANAGVEFDDPRVGYVTVQIDRATWGEIVQRARSGGQ